jgi:hypothetical protein
MHAAKTKGGHRQTSFDIIHYSTPTQDFEAFDQPRQ